MPGMPRVPLSHPAFPAAPSDTNTLQRSSSGADPVEVQPGATLLTVIPSARARSRARGSVRPPHPSPRCTRFAVIAGPSAGGGRDVTMRPYFASIMSGTTQRVTLNQGREISCDVRVPLGR